jgi:ribosomal protein S18 acetylase RimI-like enzyme
MSVAALSGLRMATAQDLPHIKALVARAYGGYVTELGVRPGPLDDDYATAIAAGQAQVIEQAGVVLALLVLIPSGDVMLLDNIAVSPDGQGLGLGRALLAYAEQSARDGGFAAIRLYTHEKMTRNQAIYARAGYVETRRVEERGLRRVYMEKPLT